MTASGRGHYLNSKAAAIAFVKRLRKRGVSNIDVGCMQINLHYHTDAFANLQDAFDLCRNAGYAADFARLRVEATVVWRRPSRAIIPATRRAARATAPRFLSCG